MYVNFEWKCQIIYLFVILDNTIVMNIYITYISFKILLI